jgi:two-component system, sporulation sensor kinase B
MEEIDYLVLQIIIVIFPIFIYQMFFGERFHTMSTNRRKIYGFLFWCSTVLLCMVFPTLITPEHRFDLRLIPITEAFLYGSNGIGLSLSIISLIFRVLINPNGMAAAFLVMSLYVPVVMLIRRTFCKAVQKKRIMIFMAIGVYYFGCSILVSSLLNNFILGHMESTIKFRLFVVIYFVTSWMAVFLIESLMEKVQMRMDLQQAEKMKLLSDLTGVFAHEIRNPMQVVRGFLQLLNEPDLAEGKRNYIQISIDELDRANSIINDFLSFARPSTNETQRVNVENQLDSVVSIMAAYAMSHNVVINTALSKGCLADINAQKFNQCLINLLKNAVESMPCGGEILVTCAPNVDNHLEISVKDQGIGMTKEQLKKLGTPYYTLKDKGTGLGLMVSYQIIHSMKGTIKVESEEGKGTKFTIRLPQIKSF